nr:hypothetical protein [Nocardiopsis kunsanensis]
MVTTGLCAVLTGARSTDAIGPWADGAPSTP